MLQPHGAVNETTTHDCDGWSSRAGMGESMPLTCQMGDVRNVQLISAPEPGHGFLKGSLAKDQR